jgi:hypothetical protein
MRTKKKWYRCRAKWLKANKVEKSASFGMKCLKVDNGRDRSNASKLFVGMEGIWLIDCENYLFNSFDWRSSWTV